MVRQAHHRAQDEAARLDEEPAQPLHTVVRHPAGGALQVAGDIVEDGPAGESHVGLDAASVLHQPALLQGHAKADDEDVGPDRVDLLDHGLVFCAVGEFYRS